MQTKMNSTIENHSNNEYIYYFLFSICIIGTIGNFIVAFVYLRKRDTQTSTFFILLLSFIDLTVCSILIPMIIYMEKIVFKTNNTIFCKMFSFLSTTTVPSSSLLMTTIAFDRYFCICKVNRSILTYKRAKSIAFSLLAFSVCLGIIPSLASIISLNWRIIKLENITLNISYLQCSVDMEGKETIIGKLIIPFKFFYDGLYLICVLLITFLYILIYKEIYTRRKLRNNQKTKLLYCRIKNSGTLINHKENVNERELQNISKKNVKYILKKSKKENQINKGQIPLINLDRKNLTKNNELIKSKFLRFLL